MMKKASHSPLTMTFLTAFVLFCLIGVPDCLADPPANAFLEKHYIFDKTFVLPPSNTVTAENPYLSGNRVTADTLDLFRSLERKFAVNSIAELDRHYDLVRQDLLARFNQTDARQLYLHYQKYLSCQILLVNDSRFETKSMEPRELLAQLYQIQIFRRERLGWESADTLFGQEVKAHEYILRRLIIIGNPELYGKEKENLLHTLKIDMWGHEPVTLGEDTEPYNRYELKMQLYAKDLAALDESGRKLKIAAFRKEFFTPDQIDRMQKAEAEIAVEDENLRRYRAEEKKIRETDGMTEDQRHQAIKALQDQFFGAEADAFRRREVMQKGAANQ